MRREQIQQEQIILPTGYTRLQYIMSTGTQYINSGVSCGGNKFRIYMDWEKYDTSTGGVLFGSSSGNDNQWTCNPYFPNTSLFHIYGAGFGVVLANAYYANVRSYVDCTVDTINQTFSFDFVQQNYAKAHSEAQKIGTVYSNILYLFASRRGTTAQNLSKHLCYRCTMWINDIKVRDFIPALRDLDSKPGLYDIVNDVFYTNAGTGEFQYA